MGLGVWFVDQIGGGERVGLVEGFGCWWCWIEDVCLDSYEYIG